MGKAPKQLWLVGLPKPRKERVWGHYSPWPHLIPPLLLLVLLLLQWRG